MVYYLKDYYSSTLVYVYNNYNTVYENKLLTSKERNLI